jgi:SAM-dependent methyltransferase
MGPYLQIPLPAMPFQAWEALTNSGAVKHWMQRSAGSLNVGDPMTVVMGDASGTVSLTVTKSVDAGQEFPSYMPYLEFELRRPSWTAQLGGRMWIEPAGLGHSLLQIFQYGWEQLDVRDPVTERRLLTNFWINAAARAQMLFQSDKPPIGPHGWSASGGEPQTAQDGRSASQGNGHHPPSAINMPAAMGFAGQVMADLGSAMCSLLAALGTRLGLFGALALRSATSAELAQRTGLSERYLREWAWGMYSAGYLKYDRIGQRFTLPPEHGAVLASENSPLSLSAGYGLLTPMADMLDDVAEAFRTGTGIPSDRYPEGLYTAMETMSAQWLDGMLVDEWLPAVDGVIDTLSGGATVADVGCGGGRAVLTMAQRFPESQFIGYDLHQPNVDRAREAAAHAGLSDRVRFVCADAADALDGPVDLVTMFDILHDVADPTDLLKAAHAAVAPSAGVVLVLESKGANDPEDNAGPFGEILYATSTLYCLPTALANGGPGLGTLGLPSQEMTGLARGAGFNRADEVAIHSPMNALYVLRP